MDTKNSPTAQIKRAWRKYKKFFVEMHWTGAWKRAENWQRLDELGKEAEALQEKFKIYLV